MKKTKFMMIAATLLAMSLAVGCGGNKKAADTTKAGTGKASGEVMIYTSIYPDIIDNMCKPNLTKAFPNMKVNWFQGGTEQVITKITGEIKADKVGADLSMVADPSYYLKLQSEKRLLNYVSPNLKDVVTAKDKDGAWASVRVSNMIIAYNADKMKAEDAPKSWKDLTDPRLKGEVQIADPQSAGTAYTALATFVQLWGEEIRTCKRSCKTSDYCCNIYRSCWLLGNSINPNSTCIDV